MRQLRLSKEMWIFVGVTSVMSVAYLAMTTSETAIKNAKPIVITPTELQQGSVIDAAITLISADAFALACATDAQVGQFSCGFNSEGKPYKRADGEALKPENIIAPYMTVDNVLFLIPGLFTQPVLKKRLEDEPPGKYSREELENRRFTVTCKLKLEQKVEKFKVRWQPNQGWGDRDSAWLGTVSDCKMTGG